jgi:4-amino-4-deoxy-L-arabinose transferase-like glycosyltransferase
MPDLKVPRFLILMLCIGLIFRLAWALQQNHLAPYDMNFGDSWWYLEYGRLLVEGRVPGPPPSAPLYLLVVGAAQHLLEPASAVLAVRLLQVLLSTVTLYLVWRLTRSFTDDNRPGLIAVFALTCSPVFILEPALILTETLYLFLLLTGLLVYIELVRGGKPARRDLAVLVISGLLLGMATLTRAVLLLFPVGLALHLLLVYGWRRGLRYAGTLLLVYSLVVSVWTVYNRLTWNIWVIGAQGFSAFLYIGATEWQGPQATDQALAEAAGVGENLPGEVDQQQELYQAAAGSVIGSNPLGWLERRAGELAGSLLQPHGTTFFGGESLKDLAQDWLAQDRSLTGLLRIINGDQFWPKLLIYLLHYTGLLAGILGLWLIRRQWRVALVLAGLIAYTLLIHFVLDAVPRYLFPLLPVGWALAGLPLTHLFDRVVKVVRPKPGKVPIPTP